MNEESSKETQRRNIPVNALQERLRELQIIAEKQTPLLIHDLAEILNASEEEVRFAINYTSQVGHEHPYVVASIITTFHQTIRHQRTLRNEDPQK